MVIVRLIAASLFCFMCSAAQTSDAAKDKQQSATEAVELFRDAQAMLGNEQLSFVATLTDAQKQIQARLDKAAQIVSARQERASKACAEIGKVLGQVDRTGDGISYKVPGCVEQPKTKDYTEAKGK